MNRLAAAALLIALASPAAAFHCPADMARIDAALAAGPAVDAAVLEQVTALRAEGERLHLAGDHEGSIAALAQAMALLGIS